MKKISRHAVDPQLVQEGVDGDHKLLESVVRSAIGRAEALSIVLSTARSYAGYLAAANEKTEVLCRALKMGAHASAAIFALGSGVSETRFALIDQYATLPATGPTDATHVGNWRIGWWLAYILRDRGAVDRLAAVPIDLLRRSSSRGDECQYLFVESLQGYEKRTSDWSTKLQAALEASDPERVDLSDEEFVLNILVPEMQMLFRLAIGEIAPFNEALQFALERHKKYWSKASRKRDPDGYLALGPLAISSVAFDAGMPIDVESEYLPKWLLEGGCRGQ